MLSVLPVNSRHSLVRDMSRFRIEATNNADWIEFPRLSPAGKKLMNDVASDIEKKIGKDLNRSDTPENVRHFVSGNAEGSVILRSGSEGSKIDFVLGSWLHSPLPSGHLNIATLLAFLNQNSDAPHLLLEFIGTEKTLVLVFDLLPRKDAVMEPEYLKRFYEDTELDNIRVALTKDSQAQTYVSPSLYVRSVVSPTSILLKFSEGTEEDLDRIIEKSVYPAITKAFSVWLNAYEERGKAPESSSDKMTLKIRDDQIKNKGIEVDLSSNMPALFGYDITQRILDAFRNIQ